MIEKLIENWLAEVNELGYHLPFCAVLMSEGYTILHVSRHGRGEHGVDVVARAPTGQLCAFQLKGPGDSTLREWQKIRPQVEDLVALPLRVPGVPEDESHHPYLVTNGEIVGDALENIVRWQEAWSRKGYPKLEIWNLHILLRKFLDAHGDYLPSPLSDLRTFVELYVTDFRDRLPREKFARFLQGLVERDAAEGKKTAIRRSIQSMVLMGGYIVEHYEREENYVSAAEAWTIIAATILHVAEREKLRQSDYQPSLSLAQLGVDRNLDSLAEEVAERPHLIQATMVLAEPHTLPARVGLVLGWLAARALNRWQARPFDKGEGIGPLLDREVRNYQIMGEVDWPTFLILALYLEKWRNSDSAETLLLEWVELITAANRGRDAEGLPSPYWLHEDVIALRTGQVPEYRQEYFRGQSYTIHPALDMLVRRMCRRAITLLWPRVSRSAFLDFRLDSPEHWFLWKVRTGDLRIYHPPLPTSWGEWRKEVAEVPRRTVPETLLRHPEWLLPIALTYPHRVNRTFTAVVDALFMQLGDIV